MTRIALGVTAVRLAVSRRDTTAAIAADRRVQAEVSRISDPPALLVRWCALAAAEALLVAGRAGDAAAVVRPTSDVTALPWERVCLARIRFARGHADAAAGLLEPVLTSDRVPSDFLVEAHLLSAVIHHGRHWAHAAAKAMNDALEIASAERIIRPLSSPTGRSSHC